MTAEIPQLESFVGKNGKVYRPSSMFAATPAAARMAQTLLAELGDDVPEGKHLSPRTASELINQKRRERGDFKVNGDPLPRQIKPFNCDFREVGSGSKTIPPT